MNLTKLTTIKATVIDHTRNKKAASPIAGRLVGYGDALGELRLRRDRMRIVTWYMIVRIDTGGAKSNENGDVTEEKKKMSTLRAMDVPVRVRIVSE